jgi:hypothetical protein
MRDDVREALENACSQFRPDGGAGYHGVAKPVAQHNLTKVRNLVLAVIRELPEEMTVVELRQELED